MPDAKWKGPSEELILRCQAGNLAAFEELFRLSERRVYRLAASILGDAGEAEDAMQEIFLRVFRRIHSYRHEAAFNTWMTAVVINVCRSLLRRSKLRRFLSLDRAYSHPDPAQPELEEIVHDRLQRQRLWSLVAGLDEKYRLPVLLVYGEGLSVQETAQALNIKTSTAYARLSTALNLLRGMQLNLIVKENSKIRENKC